MSRRLCPKCHELMDVEAIGRRPRRLVAYCRPCDVVCEPELVPFADDYPRSSDDR